MEAGGSKKGKARAACIACRSNKQRCDGNVRFPCRRCEIYKLACEYEGGLPPSTAVLVQTTPNTSIPNSPLPSASSKADSLVMAEMARSIREMSERLRSIEVGLAADRHHPASRSPSGDQSTPQSSTLQDNSHATASPTSILDLQDESHPMHVVTREVEQIDAVTGDSYSHSWARLAGNLIPADATLRGLVDMNDSEAAFSFFHKRIQPWIDCISSPDDPYPLVVQARSPFLFHVILLITHYYDRSGSDRAVEVYHGLNLIVKELLAEAILSPSPLTLNSDFCAGLVMLLYYKPLQHASFFARGIYDPGKISQATKINASSSIMLHGIMHRTAAFLGLPNAPFAFLQASSASATLIPSDVISDLRLWCWLCMGDIHGSLLYNRSLVTDCTSALRTTRIWAQVSSHPGDVRRAASLEVYGLVRTPMDSPQPTKLRLAELPRIGDDLDRWEQYWDPLLNAVQISNDPMAYTTYSVAYFATLSVFSAVFSRWSMEKKASLAEGSDDRPALSTADWVSLARATEACEKILFAVSVESTASGSRPLRTGTWNPNERPRHRKPLEVDQTIVPHFMVAPDPVTCLNFIYAMLLLVRMTSAGLIDCELELRQRDYELSTHVDTPPTLGSASKLTRLLELGAEFLDAIAPQPESPAKKHARLVRHILSAGLGVPFNNASASSMALGLVSAWPPTATTLPNRMDGWLWDLDAPMPTFNDSFDPNQLYSFNHET